MKPSQGILLGTWVHRLDHDGDFVAVTSLMIEIHILATNDNFSSF